jgi:beta-glucosidase
MKNRKIVAIAAFIGSLFAVGNADLTAVTVPIEMLHAPGAGLGYLGKVTYTLTVDTIELGFYQYDSIHVTLEIVPEDGGSALTLDAVEGAVGVVHILPKQPERDIFFRYKGSPAGKYKAVVKVTAIETEVLKKTKAMCSEASVADMVKLFSGTPTPGSTEPEASFFEQVGITTASGSLKNIRTADGPHGVNVRQDGGWATCFATCGGIACTWDVDAAYEQGIAMGEEFPADKRHGCLGPAMNIVMNPMGGRAFEYYSEDSYLSGKMAAAQVKGLAARGVISAVKHFAVNNKENDRRNMSAQVDERSLHELYLPQYKECVTKAGALGAMTAYNKINGQYCTDSKYLVEDLLRNTWGFLGYTMSDWDAQVNDKSLGDAVKYGADQLLPSILYNENHFNSNPVYAKKKAKHILYANGKVGLLDPNYNHEAYKNSFRSNEHKALVRKVGAKALVLAKNDGNVLPIPKSGKKIFITGAKYNAGSMGSNPRQSQYNGQFEHQVARLGGGDSWYWESSLVKVPDEDRISPERGIKEYLSQLNVSEKTTIVDNMYTADYIIVVTGVHDEGEDADRPNLNVFEDEIVKQAMAVTTAKTIVLFSGGSAAVPGNWSNAPAILICFGPGQQQGYSIADVLFGDVCPGGKLNMTFPKTASQTANFQYDEGTVNLRYGKPEEAHGYFKVDYMGEEPLFAFGHGLSYTTFSYSNLQVYPSKINKGDRIYVTVDVANTGSIKGDEVVQLYLSLPTGVVPVRKQDLRGFDRVTLEPGQKETVRFTLEPDDMAYFKVGAQEFDGNGKWEILSGNYKIRVGTSSKITPAPAEPSLNGSFSVN